MILQRETQVSSLLPPQKILRPELLPIRVFGAGAQDVPRAPKARRRTVLAGRHRSEPETPGTLGITGR